MKYIQKDVVLLTTGVRISDDDDWQKLWQFLQYIRPTIHIPLILRVDKIYIVKLCGGHIICDASGLVD